MNRLGFLRCYSSRMGLLVHRRNLSVSNRLKESFNIQDEADFKSKVVDSKRPVIVDFHATWCGPCKLLEPRLEAAIAATNGAVDLGKVDIDNLADIAMEYGVEVVPTVVSFKNGQIVEQFTGVQDEDTVSKFVKAIM